MRGTAEPAVAAATITPAEGRAAAVEAPGEAIMAVHDEPRRVPPPIQLTSALPTSGPPRVRSGLCGSSFPARAPAVEPPNAGPIRSQQVSPSRETAALTAAGVEIADLSS
jgi:hypothetical protein